MKKIHYSTIVWIAGGLIAGMMLGLLSWYFFISRQTNSIEQANRGRGIIESIPNVGGLIGSTAHNLRSIIGLSSTPEATTTVIGGGGILVDGTVVTTEGGSFGAEGSGSATSTEPAKPRTPTLWQLSRTPVAGITLTGTSTVTARFSDSATGHVYEADAFSGEIRRISNTLIPKVYEVLFSKTHTFLRYVNEAGNIATFSGVIASSSSASSTLQGAYLEEGIVDIATRADNAKVLYLAPSQGGVAALLANGNGSSPKRVWSSTLRGWNLSWPATTTALVSQRAAAGIQGSAYRINLTTNDFDLAYQGAGLSVIAAPSGRQMLVSTAQVGKLDMFITDGAFATTTPLSIQTIAEKCVWSPMKRDILYCAVPQAIPSTAFPDTWYRGEVHTSDVWWRVNANTGVGEKLFDPAEFSTSLDVSQPIMNDAGTHISFLDTISQTPWVLRIADYEK